MYSRHLDKRSRSSMGNVLKSTHIILNKRLAMVLEESVKAVSCERDTYKQDMVSSKFLFSISSILQTEQQRLLTLAEREGNAKNEDKNNYHGLSQFHQVRVVKSDDV